MKNPYIIKSYRFSQALTLDHRRNVLQFNRKGKPFIMKKFKDEMPSFSSRKEESSKLLSNYPDKVPIIVESQSSGKNEYKLDQNRFLVPKLYTFHEFIFHIRRRLILKNSDSLFMTVAENYFPAMNRTLSSIYNEYQDADGFLYITFSSQPVWGC